MKRTDIVTVAVMALGLAGLAAIGAAAYWLDARSFRKAVGVFARRFPDAISELRSELLTEEFGIEAMTEEDNG